MVSRKQLLLLLVVLVILLFPSSALVTRWDRNNAALITLHSLQTGDPAMLQVAEKTLISLRSDVCRGSWLLGIVYHSLGDLERRDQVWGASLRCSPAYILLVRAKAHDNISLAELAVQEHPEQAEAWFWLADSELKDFPERSINAYWQGLQRNPYDTSAWVQLGSALASLDSKVAISIYERLELERLVSYDPLLQSEPQFIMAEILAKNQPERAIQLYRQGLQHRPNDAVRWYELGDLLSKTDPHAALDAYLESCYHGDPGFHGCYKAGRMAEVLGDFQAAIRYYRLSKWAESLKRADELEQTLIIPAP